VLNFILRRQFRELGYTVVLNHPQNELVCLLR
jgi:hypothetical protein